jgi:mono/diheme cytochrome c family protein
MKRETIWFVTVSGLGAIIFLFSATLSQAQNMDKMTPGEAHYLGHCAGCHGFTGAGDGPLATGMTPSPTNFRTATLVTLPDNTIEQALLAGKGPMRSYATIFRSEDIREIMTYVRSLAVTP